MLWNPDFQFVMNGTCQHLDGVDIRSLFSLQLKQPLGQLRAAPVRMRDGQRNLLLAYSADEDIDPFMGMFFFPTDALKMAMVSETGEILWKRSLHRGNIPGTWFHPILPFDLDGDGTEEIWMVQNTDPEHPLDIKKYRLVRIDPATGETTGEFPWQGLDFRDYTMSQRYRHMLLGGYADGKPVLVTAQGTYTRLQFQAWGTDMQLLWNRDVEADSPGARGSHGCPVLDIDGDGSDEFLYGERCIRLRDGSHCFIGDEHVYNGHSDVVSPLFMESDNSWSVFTARESGYHNVAPPRVVMFNSKGRRLWSDLEQGHMDMGWVGRIGEAGEPLCYAVKIGAKRAGPDGFFRDGLEEFVWKPGNGERVSLPYSLYERLPVDLNGDGIHELVGNGKTVQPNVLDRYGNVIASLGEGARVAMLSQFLNRHGEQLLVYYPDGKVTVFADTDAADEPSAKARYARPAYRLNQRLTAVGYNLNNLGGI
jgi:hypothetical protein